MLFVPVVQFAGLVADEFPNVPVVNVQPVLGVISHDCLPFVHAPDPEGGTTKPALPVLVNVIVLLTQTVSLGDIEKSASGFFEILIPPILPGVSPQGFEIVYETVNVLFGAVPQLLESNVCVNAVGKFS